MSQAKFKFVSDAIGGDQLTVVSFTGREQVSELYRYEIEVKAPLSANIDLDDVLDASARFVTEQNGVEFPVNGILSSFEEFKTVQNYAHYKAVLVPSIWKLSNYKTNEIFYQAGDEGNIDAGLSITDIISQVLEKSGMTSADFDLGGLSSKLLKREYTCQYGESDFDFISRLLENEGVFYYFEQSATEEKIVFVNDLNYLSLPQPKLIFDVAAMANSQDNCVFGWSCRKQRLAKRVVVRNYNPEEPSLDVSNTTAIDGTGQGTEYIYGQNVQTDTEATYLSQIRAEEHICRKTQFFGESSVTRLQAGYLFLLEQHPNTKYNAIEYLAIEVNHEGHNLDMSIANDANKQTRPQYQNSFVAISADVQYRPPLKTIKPRITGTLHARIDGELDSEYAQLDSEGRYKVSLPFDFHNENHPEGLASARVRMMQPYAGKNRGMQFPMAKGTEVLLSFVDGDPDRPIIAGAINTAAAPGPVTADNQTESVIQTGGHNKIRMEDKAGSERIVFESPASNSWIRVGARNDPPVLNGSSGFFLEKGAIWTDPGAIYSSRNSFGSTTNQTLLAVAADIKLNTVETVWDSNKVGTWEFKYRATNAAGTEEIATRSFTVFDNTDKTVDGAGDKLNDDRDGIRIRTAGNLWLESKSRYAEYIDGAPPTASLPRNAAGSAATVVNQLGDIRDNFGSGYSPTGMKNYKTKVNEASFQRDVLANAHVKLSSFDTVTTQEGNIYDFGGYWNYNLGNSYAEDHLDQKAKLNNKDEHDLLDAGGPDWKALAWPDAQGTETSLAGTWSGDTVWTQKKWGKDYEYHNGDAVSVSVGSSLDVQHGGRHVEVGYRGDGSLSSWSHSGGGKSEEKKWNIAGALLSHSISKSDGVAGTSGMEFSFSNKATHEYNFGASTKFSISANASTSFSLSASAVVDISASASAMLKLAANASTVADIEFSAAGKFKVENTKVETNIPGLVGKFGAVDMDAKSLAMKSAATDIDNTLTNLSNGTVTIENCGPAIKNALLTLLN